MVNLLLKNALNSSIYVKMHKTSISDHYNSKILPNPPKELVLYFHYVIYRSCMLALSVDHILTDSFLYSRTQQTSQVKSIDVNQILNISATAKSGKEFIAYQSTDEDTMSEPSMTTPVTCSECPFSVWLVSPVAKFQTKTSVSIPPDTIPPSGNSSLGGNQANGPTKLVCPNRTFDIT